MNPDHWIGIVIVTVTLVTGSCSYKTTTQKQATIEKALLSGVNPLEIACAYQGAEAKHNCIIESLKQESK